MTLDPEHAKPAAPGNPSLLDAKTLLSALGEGVIDARTLSLGIWGQ